MTQQLMGVRNDGDGEQREERKEAKKRRKRVSTHSEHNFIQP